MFIHLNKKRGQSTLEYAIIIAVVVGALLAIQVYVKRGVQGRFKQAADDIGEQFSAGKGTYNTTAKSYTASNEMTTASQVAVDEGSELMTTTTTNVEQTQNVDTQANLEGYKEEGWGK
ncbi:MAG: hypothetical protein WCY12_02580 [Candidatus Omnitrophota bacterium]|jgi:cytoskeletal protein RodZ